MSYFDTFKKIALNPVSSAASLVQTIEVPPYFKNALTQGKSDLAALLDNSSFDETAYNAALKNPLGNIEEFNHSQNNDYASQVLYSFISSFSLMNDIVEYAEKGGNLVTMGITQHSKGERLMQNTELLQDNHSNVHILANALTFHILDEHTYAIAQIIRKMIASILKVKAPFDFVPDIIENLTKIKSDGIYSLQFADSLLAMRMKLYKDLKETMQLKASPYQDTAGSLKDSLNRLKEDMQQALSSEKNIPELQELKEEGILAKTVVTTVTARTESYKETLNKKIKYIDNLKSLFEVINMYKLAINNPDFDQATVEIITGNATKKKKEAISLLKTLGLNTEHLENPDYLLDAANIHEHDLLLPIHGKTTKNDALLQECQTLANGLPLEAINARIREIEQQSATESGDNMKETEIQVPTVEQPESGNEIAVAPLEDELQGIQHELEVLRTTTATNKALKVTMEKEKRELNTQLATIIAELQKTNKDLSKLESSLENLTKKEALETKNKVLKSIKGTLSSFQKSLNSKKPKTITASRIQELQGLLNLSEEQENIWQQAIPTQKSGLLKRLINTLSGEEAPVQPSLKNTLEQLQAQLKPLTGSPLKQRAEQTQDLLSTEKLTALLSIINNQMTINTAAIPSAMTENVANLEQQRGALLVKQAELRSQQQTLEAKVSAKESLIIQLSEYILASIKKEQELKANAETLQLDIDSERRSTQSDTSDTNPLVELPLTSDEEELYADAEQEELYADAALSNSSEGFSSETVEQQQASPLTNKQVANMRSALNDYLTARHNTFLYWLKDGIENLVFNTLLHKPKLIDQDNRKNFCKDLITLLETYSSDPSKENKDKIGNKLRNGYNDFPPRTHDKNSPDYLLTLHAQLDKVKEQLGLAVKLSPTQKRRHKTSLTA